MNVALETGRWVWKLTNGKWCLLGYCSDLTTAEEQATLSPILASHPVVALPQVYLWRTCVYHSS
jgi:hypothetical protein